jgi:muramoyltetrapeptide carboxypeptidase
MHVQIIAPSGYALTEHIEKAAQNCIELGFECVDSNIERFKQRSYFRFSGTDNERLADIEACFDYYNTNNNFKNINNNIIIPKVIMSMRGGYGMHRIVQNIDWHSVANQVAQHNLKIVGHSDFTLFHAALYAKTQIISYAGPMFTSDFACNIKEIDDFMLTHFLNAMHNKELSYSIKNYTSNNIDNIQNIENILHGKIWGGNLAILIGILGTAYFPKIQNGFLFIEDVNEPPYRVDRALHQLYLSGVLTEQQALIFGDFSNYKTTDYEQGFSLNNVIDYWAEKLAKYNIAIFTNLAFGHCKAKATIPFGGQAQIVCADHEHSYLKIN